MSPPKIYTLCVCVLFLELAPTILSWHEVHRLACGTQKELCNGIMCADVCVAGASEQESWLSWALAYQRKLQMPQVLAKALLPGSHNSAISEAYGFGIEKYAVAALLDEDPATLNDHDDLGEGVCQHLTVLDQLRMGLRHIELDVWWTPLTRNQSAPVDANGGEMLVCHSPVPLLPRRTIRAVEEAARDRGLELGWDTKKLSCLGTSRTLREALEEVREWLDDSGTDDDEMVVLFMDTKWLPHAAAADYANAVILDVLGDLVWTPSEDGPDPLAESLESFRYSPVTNRSRRVLMEGNGDGWTKGEATPQQVFYPTFWAYQFDDQDLAEFPNCSFAGDRTWWGKQWVRALLNNNPGTVATEGMTRCGVQLAAGN